MPNALNGRSDLRRADEPGSPDRVFAGEEFHRYRSDRGNKSIVNPGSGDGHVAIFTAPSTRRRGAAIFPPIAVAERWFRMARKEFGEMRQVNSFLRSASSRIGRRLKLIVAIAAASLPSAGA
jgi:hypothetical protein